VQGLDNLPDGAALLVSNHSGGMLAMDFPVFAVDFYDRFGVGRPLYLLTHDIAFVPPAADILRRSGLVSATRRNAQTVLESGASLMVFPGGDYDAGRPTCEANRIDFAGRTGYVSTAMDSGAPIVAVVSIGGQENQLYLSRGCTLARVLGVQKLTRVSVLPVTVGFPWGLTVGLVFPLNVPFPTKIITRVLEPIDIRARFGRDPDIREVDAHVREVMQGALDELARERRFPVLG
jgi:1-acyl-sn-glycerol-3-phosphate acyltransferase